jgi:hypothetical protein
MVSEPRDWNVPTPLRALLWWPPVAFVLVMLDPSASAGTIAAAGAVLAVLGVVGSTVTAAVARRLRSTREVDEPAAAPPSLAMSGAPERMTPLGAEQRAA